MDKQREKYFTVNEVTVGDKGIGATDKLLFRLYAAWQKERGTALPITGIWQKFLM